MGYDKNPKKWSNFSLVLINMCRNTQDLETIYQRSILGRPPLVLTTLLWVIVLKEKWITFASFSRSTQIIFLRVRFFKNLRTFFGEAPYLQYIYTTVYLFIYFVCLNFIFLLTIVEHDNIGILRRVSLNLRNYRLNYRYISSLSKLYPTYVRFWSLHRQFSSIYFLNDFFKL